MYIVLIDMLLMQQVLISDKDLFQTKEVFTNLIQLKHILFNYLKEPKYSRHLDLITNLFLTEATAKF